MNEKKVAIILADGFEEIEALTVVDILRRAGVKCDIVALANNPKVDNAETIAPQSANVAGTHNIIVAADQTFDQANWNEYDMLVLPGGLPGADTLRDDPRVISLVQDFANNPEKRLAAICAAPQVLAKANVVSGRKVTSYPADTFQNALETAGAEYIDNQNVVTDKNFITSRGPATASDFAFKILETLGFDPTPLKSGMLYV